MQKQEELVRVPVRVCVRVRACAWVGCNLSVQATVLTQSEIFITDFTTCACKWSVPGFKEWTSFLTCPNKSAQLLLLLLSHYSPLLW